METIRFGTAGFGGSEAYYQKILTNVHAAIDGSNTVAGEYMCQGKMPQSVRDRYVKMKEMPDAKPNLDALHIAKLIGRVCEAKRPHSVSERPARALS